MSCQRRPLCEIIVNLWAFALCRTSYIISYIHDSDTTPYYSVLLYRTIRSTTSYCLHVNFILSCCSSCRYSHERLLRTQELRLIVSSSTMIQAHSHNNKSVNVDAKIDKLKLKTKAYNFGKAIVNR